MKDIKSLFMAAKSSGRDIDIYSYSSAIQEAMQTPIDYASNLEYIIQSNIGVKTLREFVESNGLPIVLYDKTIGLIEECIRRSEIRKLSSTDYTEARDWLKSYRDKYINEFAMFDFYCDELPSDYISTYYGVNSRGVQNRKLAAGMINKFHEIAIPDVLINASELGTDLHVVENVINDHFSDLMTPVFCEWVKMCDSNCISTFTENAASTIVKNVNDRNHQVYRESVISGEDANYTYSEDELRTIANYIHFKESLIPWSDELGLDPFKEQNEIYSMYETFDGLLFEEDDNIYETSDEEYVPIFGIVKSYSDDKIRNDGTPKSKGDMMSTNLKHVMGKLTRGDVYSHAVLSLDPTMKHLYSFESPGFVRDSFDQNIWITTDSIYFCVMFVKKSERDAIQKYINSMDGASNSKFAFLNMLRTAVGKPEKIDKRFICSAFVAYCLGYSNPKNLTRDYSRFRPEDLTILPRAFYVMNCRDRNDFYKRQDEFNRKVKMIFDAHKDEIEEYNNYLPKVLLKDRVDKLKTIDKILDWIVTRAPRTNDTAISESSNNDKEDH